MGSSVKNGVDSLVEGIVKRILEVLNECTKDGNIDSITEGFEGRADGYLESFLMEDEIVSQKEHQIDE